MSRSRAEELLDAPPDRVILSIDGPEATHDQVRMVDGAFSRALAGAKALHQAKERAKSRTPHLILNAALTGRTYTSALETIEVAKRFGAEALNFQHFWFVTRPMIDAHNTRWGDCFPLDFDRVGGTATTGVDTKALAQTVHRLRTEDHGLPITLYPDLQPEEIETYYTEPEAFTRRKLRTAPGSARTSCRTGTFPRASSWCAGTRARNLSPRSGTATASARIAAA